MVIMRGEEHAWCVTRDIGKAVCAVLSRSGMMQRNTSHGCVVATPASIAPVFTGAFLLIGEIATAALGRRRLRSIAVVTKASQNCRDTAVWRELDEDRGNGR